MSSGISFEWVQRNAERINYTLDDIVETGNPRDAVTILTFLNILAMPEQDYALSTYAEAGETDAIANRSADFLKAGGIKYIT